jgi:predicted oxidoreductase
MPDTDVVVIGAGLSGLVAATELVARGRRVTLVDAEPPASLGGQAWWSFGGLLLIDSPEQRRLKVADSTELAFADWLASADFAEGADLGEGPDRHGYAWAQRYVELASGELRSWLHGKGVRWFPLVQWAERGGHASHGRGNTVPRFHVVWGTGPAILHPFVLAARDALAAGKLHVLFRRRVVELLVTDGAVTGVRADVLAESAVGRGTPSSRERVGSEEISAGAVVVASGGIGANHDLVRSLWPRAAGQLPEDLLSGVPDSTDGVMMDRAVAAGAAVVHTERMWHYPEGIAMQPPVWSRHGVRILPGPSSLWLDADGGRLPAPLFPGFDALGALQHLTQRGDEHSWFVLNREIMTKEFAFSGSDMNPDLTGKSIRQLLKRVTSGATPVVAFSQTSPEFVWADDVASLAQRMNALVGDERISAASLAAVIAQRDAAVEQGGDAQLDEVHRARGYVVDKRMRVAEPKPITTPEDGPLLAVRLRALTRKTLGGLHTDTSGRVLRPDGSVLPGLWAVGEAAGFGGGGIHGHRSLEGTFLGACLLTGRVVGRAI